MKIFEGENSNLPVKVNPSGVIPAIFASSLLLLPTTLTAFSSNDSSGFVGFVAAYLGPGQLLYYLFFGGMIIFFAYFYTLNVSFKPEEVAENIKKQGGFVPGIRPGPKTAEYLEYVIIRVLVVGSLYLAAVCLLPEFLRAQMNVPFYFGGTSVLIVVSVTLDTVAQLQSHLLAYQYEGLIEKSRLGRKEAKGRIGLEDDYNIIRTTRVLGKGTQAQRLVDKHNLMQLSTGDMLRDTIAKGSDLGIKAKAIMDKGELVSDEIIISMISEKIQGNKGKGFIFDGFPRNLEQAEALDEMLDELSLSLDLVIEIVVKDDVLINRIEKRARESQHARSDDNEEVLKNRLNVYHENTEKINRIIWVRRSL